MKIHFLYISIFLKKYGQNPVDNVPVLIDFFQNNFEINLIK